MGKYKLVKRFQYASVRLPLLVVGLAFVCQGNASSVAWVGDADYTVGSSGVAGAEKVEDFSGYDFAPGPALLKNLTSGSILTPSVGDEIKGYTQSFVTLHQGSGGPILSSKLNFDYELTFRADFTEKVTAVVGSELDFDVTGGSWEIYLDDMIDGGTADADFSVDSGFTDGGKILEGTVVGGSGDATIGGGGTTLSGDSTILLKVTFFDADVFEPDTIVAGSSIFTLQLGVGTEVSATSVQGLSDGEFVTVDGNLALRAVPLPAAGWLFGSAVLGLSVVSRRKKAGLMAAG